MFLCHGSMPFCWWKDFITSLTSGHIEYYDYAMFTDLGSLKYMAADVALIRFLG